MRPPETCTTSAKRPRPVSVRVQLTRQRSWKVSVLRASRSCTRPIQRAATDAPAGASGEANSGSRSTAGPAGSQGQSGVMAKCGNAARAARCDDAAGAPGATGPANGRASAQPAGAWAGSES